MSSTTLGITGFLYAEISGDDLGMGLDFVRRAFGDLLAEIEHRDAMRDARDQRHVMLDQQHGCALRVDLLNDGGEFFGLLGIETGGGLIEQQQLRLGGQRAGEFEQTLLAIEATVRRRDRRAHRVPTKSSSSIARSRTLDLLPAEPGRT